ncbi:hypothetical protein Ciccas_001814 [Cichlidogyrus casuarinus]|uniref:Carboxylesterase type B domain-containing protein n=1 Tax=Cichlidogyrus casuarinus TaxID=1844966 RepID=A0ABD2QJ34_9PLAT
MRFLSFPWIFIIFVEFTAAQHWWNFKQVDEIFTVPTFTPLPDRRYTHVSKQSEQFSKKDDVIVNVPKAGMGEFVGFTQHINYEYSWTSWPAERGNYINCFLGIPYATPPLGPLRFRAPQPAYFDSRFPWISQSFKPTCLSSNFSEGIFESEDCLYLNIFSPNVSFKSFSFPILKSSIFQPDTLFPVIIHIHGETLHSGFAYQPHAMVSEGVIVVTFSYRTGVLGFLASGDFASMGNFGLLDQLMAIQWVKENIIWFRGDPDKITIMGDGVGANYAGLHLISPVSRGLDLFNQAILMSGSDLSAMSVSSYESVRTRQYAIELGRLLNCPAAQKVSPFSDKYLFNKTYLDNRFHNSSPLADFVPDQRIFVEYQKDIDAYALISCLRFDHTAEEIIENANKVRHLRGAPEQVWTPVVDGASGFIPRVPRKERMAGRFKKIAILAGFTHDYASLILARKMKDWDNFDWANDVLTEEMQVKTINRLVYFMNAYRFNETVEELVARYTWWPNRKNETARREQLIALVSDWLVVAPLQQVLRDHAQFAPTFMYEFAYRSPNDTRHSTKHGIYDGVELPFLFGYPFMNSTFWEELRPSDFPGNSSEWVSRINKTFMNYAFTYPQDHNISQLLIKSWTNFAKFGNPTPEKLQNLTWRPFTGSMNRYAHLWINSTLHYNYRPELMAFWRDRFPYVAEIFSASPPRFYYTLEELQQATIVVAAILLLLMIVVASMCYCLSRKPKPDQFRSEYRCVDHNGEFTSHFKDAYSNPSVRQKMSQPHPPPPPPPLMGSTYLLNRNLGGEQLHQAYSEDLVETGSQNQSILSPVYAAANFPTGSITSGMYTKLGQRRKSSQIYLNTQSPDEWYPEEEQPQHSRRGSLHEVCVDTGIRHPLSKLATDV